MLSPSHDALVEGPYRIDPVALATVVQEITNEVSRMSVKRTSTGVSARASLLPKVSGSTRPTQIKATHTARAVPALGARRFTCSGPVVERAADNRMHGGTQKVQQFPHPLSRDPL